MCVCYRGMENFIRNKYERKIYVSKDKSKEQLTSSKVRMMLMYCVDCLMEDGGCTYLGWNEGQNLTFKPH